MALQRLWFKYLVEILVDFVAGIQVSPNIDDLPSSCMNEKFLKLWFFWSNLFKKAFFYFFLSILHSFRRNSNKHSFLYFIYCSIVWESTSSLFLILLSFSFLLLKSKIWELRQILIVLIPKPIIGLLLIWKTVFINTPRVGLDKNLLILEKAWLPNAQTNQINAKNVLILSSWSNTIYRC